MEKQIIIGSARDNLRLTVIDSERFTLQSLTTGAIITLSQDDITEIATFAVDTLCAYIRAARTELLRTQCEKCDRVIEAEYVTSAFCPYCNAPRGEAAARSIDRLTAAAFSYPREVLESPAATPAATDTAPGE
jgi:hypothetical protein